MDDDAVGAATKQLAKIGDVAIEFGDAVAKLSQFEIGEMLDEDFTSALMQRRRTAKAGIILKGLKHGWRQFARHVAAGCGHDGLNDRCGDCGLAMEERCIRVVYSGK